MIAVHSRTKAYSPWFLVTSGPSSGSRKTSASGSCAGFGELGHQTVTVRVAGGIETLTGDRDRYGGDAAPELGCQRGVGSDE